MMYINEGTNTDIVAEFSKLRLEMVKDKVGFNTAILNNDYKKAREIAHKINARCELFYRKLDNTNITVSEALVGTSAKVVRDTAMIIGALFLSIEVGMKAVEVIKGQNLKKSDKNTIRKAAYSTAMHGNTKEQLIATVAGGAFSSVVKICTSITNKVTNNKDVSALDLNSYYIEIRDKMKVLCVKSKMLINEVDVLEKKYGALEKKEQLEKELKDAKNTFKESEELIVNRDLMDIALEHNEEISVSDFVFEYTYVTESGEYITESFKDIVSPLRAFKEKIKKIKEDKPDQYDDIKKIEEFLDKHEDDITKAAKLLEDEPEKLHKNEVKWLIRICFEFIATAAGTALMAVNPVLGGIIGVGAYMFMLIDMIVTGIALYIRGNDDVAVLKDLSKIKNALSKINDKKLPDKYKKKISSIITKISDAEEMAYGKLKVAKESVDPEILAVYEACSNGSITEDQREELISSIKANRVAANIITEAPSLEDDTLRDKYNEVRRIVYEKCANGEFSEDAREDILKAAYNKIFNIVESDAAQAASAANAKVDADAKKDLDEMNKKIEKAIPENPQ